MSEQQKTICVINNGRVEGYFEGKEGLVEAAALYFELKPQNKGAEIIARDIITAGAVGGFYSVCIGDFQRAGLIGRSTEHDGGDPDTSRVIVWTVNEHVSIKTANGEYWRQGDVKRWEK